MNMDVQKLFMAWIAVLLPALLLIAGAGYNTFMYIRANHTLTAASKIAQGLLGPFSIFFDRLNSTEGRKYLRRALAFAVAFALYVGFVLLGFNVLIGPR